jgi:signal recognition particle subunit SRP54
MMKQMRGGNMPAGLPNIGSMPKPQQSNNIPKKKSRSGNPAKRALEEGI